MHLIQLLLPLQDNEDQPVANAEFDRVFDELTERFGGVTAYQRSPAEGAWKARPGVVSYDRVVNYEVMVPKLDRAWWKAYRETLEGRFRQEKILIRATEVVEL
jgi:hypothetical protein